MIFKQYENGSCDIEFSEEEIKIIIKNKKIHLSDETLRHFGNNLVRIVAEWNLKFKKEIQEKTSFSDTKIVGK
jgi:hypothetical protein